jgi:hypothetical protein
MIRDGGLQIRKLLFASKLVPGADDARGIQTKSGGSGPEPRC